MNCEFSDLVDIDRFQELFDSIYKATGIAAGIADANGIVLTRTGWTDVCTRFHRGDPRIANRCVESTKSAPELAAKAIAKGKGYIYYECENGIMHAITPIYIKDKCVAVVYKSQFFLSDPDLEYFKAQARTLGLPEGEYIEAIKKVPVYSKEEMDRFMEFASRIAKLFAQIGYDQITLLEEQTKSEHRYQELMAKHQELMAIYEEIGDMEEELHYRKHKIEHQEGALKVSQERIRYLAYYDAVTGLPNRLNVSDRITHWIASAKRENKKGALFFLDIDNFKVINDTFGHGFGDKVLKRFGTGLAKISEGKGLVGRFGGDEFIMVRFGIEDRQDVENTISSILGIFDAPWVIDGFEVYPTVSVGITMFPDDGDTTEVLLKNADIAMYEAKKYGKNTYEFFEKSMNDRVIHRMEMDRDLRNALDRDEFHLVYQPQVNSKTGRVEAVEALIRWNHPKHGLIPPAYFIPFAEDTGLIIPIGEWVLRTACKQNKKWQDKGYNPIRVSVNISPLQLRRWNFISLVRDILEDVELDPSYLELEITENNIMESTENNIEALQQLYQMGVRIALDDFGTGYSSLNYLHRLPINNLKIDRSFVEDITNDSDKRYIAQVIINLAHRMNLMVTAEGVETEEQLRMLVNQRCDMIQGFLFSRPLPSEDIEEILRRGRLDIAEYVQMV